MTPEEIAWMAIFHAAGVMKSVAGDMPATNGIIGRSITYLVGKLVVFWGRHKARLIPFLTQLAIAALEAVATAKPDIDRVNPPGPP